MKLVAVENLEHRYESQLVLSVDRFDINRGDFVAVIGPNGGGKSTLVKLILGLLPLQKGTIEIAPKVALGYVPQEVRKVDGFNPTVMEVVLSAFANRGGWGYTKEQKESSLEALEQVGALELASKQINHLSGGQRQRVYIARALASGADVLILDEPFANLDPQSQQEIYTLLERLHQEVAVVMVSHDISVVLRYATKALHINQQATIHELHDKSRFFHLHEDEGHICEVELMEMIGSKCHRSCDD